MKERIAVGLGEVKVLRGPEGVLVAYGLGSCVGVILHDPEARVGGMAHVVLPGGRDDENEARYADRAIPLLMERVQSRGGRVQRAWVKIAGGARMFSTSTLDIGTRNIEAVERAITAAGLRLVSRDVGGGRGRTVVYDPESGEAWVRTIGEVERAL